MSYCHDSQPAQGPARARCDGAARASYPHHTALCTITPPKYRCLQIPPAEHPGGTECPNGTIVPRPQPQAKPSSRNPSTAETSHRMHCRAGALAQGPRGPLRRMLWVGGQSQACHESLRSQPGSGHTPGRTGWLWPCPRQGQVHCPSGGEEPARHDSLLWPWLHKAERREEMFELSEQETSIYACSPASRISSAAGLLGDFVTSAKKQSRVSKKNR